MNVWYHYLCVEGRIFDQCIAIGSIRKSIEVWSEQFIAQFLNYRLPLVLLTPMKIGRSSRLTRPGSAGWILLCNNIMSACSVVSGESSTFPVNLHSSTSIAPLLASFYFPLSTAYRFFLNNLLTAWESNLQFPIIFPLSFPNISICSLSSSPTFSFFWYC